MERPNSVQDDHSHDLEQGDPERDRPSTESVVDDGATGDGSANAPAADRPVTGGAGPMNADSPDGGDASGMASDADSMPVDQWLAQAESDEESGEDTVAAASPAAPIDGDAPSDAPSEALDMSEIMAELLAAAEKSAQHAAGDASVDDTPLVTADADDAADITEVASPGPEKPTIEATSAKDAAQEAATGETEATTAEDVETETDKHESGDAETEDHKHESGDAETENDDVGDRETPAGDAEDPETENETAVARENEAGKETEKGATVGDKITPVLPGAPPQPAAPAKRRRRRGSLAAKVLVGMVIGAYALLVAAWGIDMAGHDGKAQRGVLLAGVDVDGQDRDDLDRTIDELSRDLADQPLKIAVGDVEVTSDPVTLGARFDRGRMIDEALAARRDGLFFVRPITWAIGLFSSESIAPRYIADTDAARDAAEEIIGAELDKPVEPTLEIENDMMTVTPGSAGVTIEPREIVGRLPSAVEQGPPYRLELIPRDSDPELDTATLTELADEINSRTEQPITVQVLDEQVDVEPRTQLSWIDLDTTDEEPTWVVNEERALEDLKPLFPTLGSEDQQAKFTIVEEEPLIVPAAETVICCEAGAGEILQRTIDSPPPAPVTDEDDEAEEAEEQPLRTARLAPEITGFDEGVAELESLGIVEQVSTFTTEHACCQNRVKNIQRFADLMQGVIIRPGEELSLNEFVGQRTTEKGFVADGAIALGNFEQQVGGGISQYATTFFNASFFAGMDFLEYQSHSIYISRYPRGREATISWRKPDLKIRNNTDYGILVWNEYTPTSITVSFYSTKHLTVEALPLKRSSDRQCRIDITPRRITFPDGSQTEDQVFASYRPGEGLDCNGNSTTPEDDPVPAPVPPPEPEPNPVPEPEPEPEPEPGGEDEVLPPD